MNILPDKICFGTLRFYEIYDDFYGPKCFSVKDKLNQLYLVYWSGDFDCQSDWVYMPISVQRLDELRRGEVSFHQVFKNPEQKMYKVSNYLDADGIIINSECDDVDVNSSSINLPPADFEINYDNIQYLEPESKWDFNLKIAKNTRGSNPDREMVTDIIDSFSEIIESLMKFGKKKPKIYPLTAAYGSFDVKFSTNNHEDAIVAINQFQALLSDPDDLDMLLSDMQLDPYRLKTLLDITQLNKLELTLKPKTPNIFDKPIVINSGKAFSLIKKLDKSTETFIDSSLVPQANDLEKLIEIIELREKSELLSFENVNGLSSARQVTYYTHAAWCLGLMYKNTTLTAAGKLFCIKDKESKYRFLADRFESSDFGWTWMQWAGVNNIRDLDPSSAFEFIDSCVKGLNTATAKRRATSLSSWLVKLKGYA